MGTSTQQTPAEAVSLAADAAPKREERSWARALLQLAQGLHQGLIGRLSLGLQSDRGIPEAQAIVERAAGIETMGEAILAGHEQTAGPLGQALAVGMIPTAQFSRVVCPVEHEGGWGVNRMGACQQETQKKSEPLIL